jgi:type IV pilus assembly protein PilQ
MSRFSNGYGKAASVLLVVGMLALFAVAVPPSARAQSDKDLDALEQSPSSNSEDENLEELFDGADKPAPMDKPASEGIASEGAAPELKEPTDSKSSNRAVATESFAVEEPSTPNQVTNLEFKSDNKGSQIVVSALRKIRFTENKSAGARQFVYLLENTETPEKFQRAYDTTEFSSAVALFTLFQIPGGSSPTSKLIVQLREDQTPKLVDSERGLVIEFPPSVSGDPKIVDTAKRDLLSGDNIYARGSTYSGEVIQRLEIKNSDIQDVLRLIARTSGYNVVIGDDVTGKIGTLSLTNIPWDQAFTLVLQSKKLGFVREGNVLRVGTSAALRTEKEEAAAVEQATEKVEPLKTILLPVSYAKAADLAPRAKPFMTSRGSVEVDNRTNTVIIRDIEKVVTRIQRLFQTLDTQPPRVSISAKVVEMRSSLTRNLGIRTLSNSVNIEGTNNSISTTLNATGAGSGSFSATLSAVDFMNLNASFQLAELESKLKTLANPSVSVVANQTGTVSESIAFFVPNTTVIAGVVTPGFTQVNTTLNLTVTPIVSGDGSIFMNVSVTNDIPDISGGQSTISSRAVNTQILVENGDTAVIGGVFQNSVQEVRDGIPILGKIPILGYFFAGRNQVDRSSEIFIFLTARIMNAEESFKRTL